MKDSSRNNTNDSSSTKKIGLNISSENKGYFNDLGNPTQEKLVCITEAQFTNPQNQPAQSQPGKNIYTTIVTHPTISNHTIKNIENIYSLKKPALENKIILDKLSTMMNDSTIKRLKWWGGPADFTNLSQEIIIGAQLGKGSFANVYRAFDKKLEKDVAVKIY